MKRLGVFIVIGIVLWSCAKENTNVMYVKGNIKGLKKGVLYLEKQKDSVFVKVDSLEVNGSSEFLLSDEVESPEIYYLTLSKSKKKIPFFGEKDTIEISASLDKMDWKANISGSKNQELLDQYNEIKRKFSYENMDLLKAEVEANQNNDQDSVAKLQLKKQRLLRNSYLYSTNFALTHKDQEVAPYVALTDLFNANIKLLDTINSTLAPEVKASKYGKALDAFVKEIKAKE